MQDAIEFTLNGTEYWASGQTSGFVWANALGEESRHAHATLLDAQQDAHDWKSGRKERATAEDEAEEDSQRYAREQWHNRNGDVL